MKEVVGRGGVMEGVARGGEGGRSWVEGRSKREEKGEEEEDEEERDGEETEKKGTEMEEIEKRLGEKGLVRSRGGG
jgi:hypothetical protein